MRKRILTKEQDVYLRSIADGKSVQKCTDELNKHFGTQFTISQIKNYKSRNKIVSGKNPWEFVDLSKRRVTTKEQDEWILEHFAGTGNPMLACMLNEKFGTSFTAEQMKNYKSRNKLNSGLTGQFSKGHTPANKGKKMSKEQYDISKHTMFKKGNIPPNRIPIGSERFDKNGYVQIKVQDGNMNMNWKFKQVKVWEDANGTVPKGHIVIFLDGDRTNFDLDNLKMISKSTNARLNQNHLRHSDRELTKTGVAMAEVITAISSAKRRMGGK